MNQKQLAINGETTTSASKSILIFRHILVQILKNAKEGHFLLKEKGFTINGVKKFLINESSFNLDEISNRSINASKNNLKTKLEKISNLLKEIKKLG